jgi:hypothetical protein
VGAIGGLGGFVLPVAFGVANDLADVCDELLHAVVRSCVGESFVDALCDSTPGVSIGAPAQAPPLPPEAGLPGEKGGKEHTAQTSASRTSQAGE